jgi:hypothetical protein
MANNAIMRRFFSVENSEQRGPLRMAVSRQIHSPLRVSFSLEPDEEDEWMIRQPFEPRTRGQLHYPNVPVSTRPLSAGFGFDFPSLHPSVMRAFAVNISTETRLLDRIFPDTSTRDRFVASTNTESGAISRDGEHPAPPVWSGIGMPPGFDAPPFPLMYIGGDNPDIDFYAMGVNQQFNTPIRSVKLTENQRSKITTKKADCNICLGENVDCPTTGCNTPNCKFDICLDCVSKLQSDSCPMCRSYGFRSRILNTASAATAFPGVISEDQINRLNATFTNNYGEERRRWIDEYSGTDHTQEIREWGDVYADMERQVEQNLRNRMEIDSAAESIISDLVRVFGNATQNDDSLNRDISQLRQSIYRSTRHVSHGLNLRSTNNSLFGMTGAPHEQSVTELVQAIMRHSNEAGIRIPDMDGDEANFRIPIYDDPTPRPLQPPSHSSRRPNILSQQQRRQMNAAKRSETRMRQGNTRR